jgi:anaerobic magnesium-protoporphyrin IX monomethyl ester cyclase
MKLQRDIQRVLLLFPPTRIGNESHPACLPPMGLMYLAAAIRGDYDVRILDATVEDYYTITPMPGGFQRFGLPYPEIRRRIEQFRPDIVGMTCLWSASAPVIREIGAIIKDVDPRILTIIGGAAPTYAAESFFAEDPSLDFIALGEGEHTFRDLLARLRTGRELSDVDGLAYRRPDGSVHVSPRTAFIEDLDSLPFPARDLVPLEKYFAIGRPQSLSCKSRRNTSFMSSRGCTARCIFCSSTKFWGGTLRVRSPENVLAEMRQLKEIYGVEELQFVDDNLTSNKKAARQIFEMMVREQLGFHWSTPNGIAVWTLTPEMVDLMKQAGCYEVTLAFESGVQEVLTDIVKKPLRLSQAVEATAYVKSVGIRTNAFFIVGFPGEKLDQMRETFRFARTVQVDSAAFYVATPLPGTELLQICQEKGYLPEGFRFEDANYSRPMLTTPEFTPDQLERLVVSEFWRFNLYTLLSDPLRFFRKHGSIFKNPRFAADLLLRLGRKLGRVVWKAALRPFTQGPQPGEPALPGPGPAPRAVTPAVEPIVSLRSQRIAARAMRKQERSPAG